MIQLEETGPDVRIHDSADVAPEAVLGGGTVIWHLAQVRERAEVGVNCVIGRGAYVGAGVRIGDSCKIQNHALVYEPAVLEDGVFVGPAVVFTNDHFPRAITPDGAVKQAGDWEPVGVRVRHGASIGARAVCVAPVTIGRWALVAAGAVVVDDVADHALVGGVPARRLGWVGRSGRRLEAVADGIWACPATRDTYAETSAGLARVHGRVTPETDSHGIRDVAQRLIARAAKPVDIVFTGLRPGEKMHEVLVGEDEQGVYEHHPRIRHVVAPPIDPADVTMLPVGDLSERAGHGAASIGLRVAP